MTYDEWEKREEISPWSWESACAEKAWNAAIEEAAKAAENTPTVLCENGDFMSERCAKAIRNLKPAG